MFSTTADIKTNILQPAQSETAGREISQTGLENHSFYQLLSEETLYKH